MEESRIYEAAANKPNVPQPNPDPEPCPEPAVVEPQEAEALTQSPTSQPGS